VSVRVVRVATSGRRFRTYVGTLPGGRRLPGGPRPIEQIVAFIGVLVLTMGAALVLPYPTLAIFAVGGVTACVAAVSLGFVKYDGVPIVGKVLRAAALVIDRKPTVVAAEELDRQVARNPQAFVINTD
jgi:hypothetical protein